MEENSSSSHTGRWLVGALMAAPLLYVLTFPWVDYYRLKHGWECYTDPFHGEPSLIVKAYWLPMEGLKETPLWPWLQNYRIWLWEKFP